jgi:hypothetical protein
LEKDFHRKFITEQSNHASSLSSQSHQFWLARKMPLTRHFKNEKTDYHKQPKHRNWLVKITIARLFYQLLRVIAGQVVNLAALFGPT